MKEDYHQKKKKDVPVYQTENVQSLEKGKTEHIVCEDYNTAMTKLQEEIEQKFTKKRRHTDVLGTAYAMLDLQGKSNRVLDCGTFLEFKVTPEKAKLHLANFCKDRLCPMCNWRRSLKIYSQVSKVMDHMQGYQFLFLTLTVKNCTAEDLPQTVQLLYDGWRKLYHKNKIFKNSIAGTFRSLEVTRNQKDNTYHPHLHVILAVKTTYYTRGNYISQNAWSEMWQDACDLDYKPVVFVEKCYIKTTDGQKVKENIDYKKAVAEATKYAVKGSDYLNPEDMEMTVENVEALLSSLSGRRLCGWTGVFNDIRKQLNLDDAENGDLIHTDDDDIRDDIAFMIVRYQWRSGVYVAI